MENWNTWWAALTALNQGFFVAALFFSVFFLWQLVMAIIGVSGGDGALDTSVDSSWEHETPADAQDTLVAFKLLSVRSILAFATMFSWAGALYLNRGLPVTTALFYALIWGLGGMVCVALLFFLMRHLSESGTMRIGACVGSNGIVHLDIPVDGLGEIRMLCSGVMTHFRAKSADGKVLKAGTEIRVVRILGPNSVEVVAASAVEGKDGQR